MLAMLEAALTTHHPPPCASHNPQTHTQHLLIICTQHTHTAYTPTMPAVCVYQCVCVVCSVQCARHSTHYTVHTPQYRTQLLSSARAGSCSKSGPPSSLQFSSTCPDHHHHCTPHHATHHTTRHTTNFRYQSWELWDNVPDYPVLGYVS